MKAKIVQLLLDNIEEYLPDLRVLRDFLNKTQNKTIRNERRVKRQARDEGQDICKTCGGGEVYNE